MIETPGGNEDEDEEQDNYLDNLENDDSDWIICLLKTLGIVRLTMAG